MTNDVDVVITWVDGSDPNHKQKLNHLLNGLGGERPVAALPTRFNALGEIEYCIRSILLYAPWVRKIFLVTDNQIPAIFTTLQQTEFQSKIEIIDHREIFRGYEQWLPTFNSLSIETVLWRIKGLADHFIYFNDDCFLLQPVTQEDFFIDHQLVLRGEMKNQTAFKFWPWQKKKKIEPHRATQERSAQLAGWEKKFLHLPHTPFPLLRSSFNFYFKEDVHLFADNLKYPLRHPKQFWPISYAHHRALKENNARIDNRKMEIMVNAETHSLEKIKKRLAFADNCSKVAFACIQSLDRGAPKTQELLLNWLNQRIPLTLR